MKKLLPVVIAMLILLTACGTSAPETSNKLPEDSPKTVEESEEPIKSSEDNRGIPGSNYIDITMNLEDLGIPQGEYNKSADQSVSAHYCSSSNTDANSGDMYSYDMSIDGDNEIISTTFDIGYGGLSTPEEFCSAADNYLGFCSTMPYDTSDTVASKEWVMQNIPSVADLGEDGKAGEVSTTIGNATFTLCGNKKDYGYGTFWLNIKLAQ